MALGVVVFIVTALWGFQESWNGIQPVASTLNGLVVPMFFLVLIVIVIAFATRKGKPAWGTYVVAVATALILILGAFGAYAIQRGNTAADRFADDIDRFPVPTGFQFDAKATAAETSDPDQTQYVVRVWKGGQTFASECPAVKKAFEKWDDGPVQRISSVCTFASSESYRNVRIELKGNVLILEMWLDKASAFTF